MISRVAAPDTYDRHRASVALRPGTTLQLDNGAQVTGIGSAITNQLDLRPPGHGWHRFCRAVRADWPGECGVDGARPLPGEPFTDGHSDLDRLRSIAPDMKCILGVDFFERFDLLLDTPARPCA